MARGKHSNMAERRKEVFAKEDEIEAYKRANVRLHKEVVELKAEIVSIKDANAQTVRKLNALINEGTSLELEVSKDRIKKLQDELGKLRVSENKSTRQRNTMLIRLTDLLQAYGMTREVAIETLTRISGDTVEDFKVLWENNPGVSKLTPEQINSLQRAKGIR